MASGNKWLGKIKSGAKSVQEAAKTRLEKVSETIDKKIKEAQEDLDRQRATEASGVAAPRIQRWRPSVDNPDGEIIAEIKPPPIEPSVAQSPSPNPELLSPNPEPPAPEEELFTVARKPKDKRRSTRKSDQKDDSVKQNDSLEESIVSLDNFTRQTISEDVTTKHSNELNANASIGDEFLESTTLSQKDELLSTQDSTNYPENEINTGKEELASSNTAPNQDITQPVISHEPSIDHSTREETPKEIPIDEQPALMNTDDSLVEQSSSENIPLNESNDELQASVNIDDLSTVDSSRENILTNEPVVEKPTLPNTDDSVTIDSRLKEIPADEWSVEQPTLPNIDDSRPEEAPADEPSVEQPAVPNIDDSRPEKVPADEWSIEQQAVPNIDDSRPEEVPADEWSIEQQAVPNIDDSRSEEVPADEWSIEQPALPNIADSHLEETPTDEPNVKQLPSTNTNDSTIDHSHLENIPAKDMTDELLPSTNTDDSPVEHVDPENTPVDKIDDEQPAAMITGDSTNVDTHPESIPIVETPDELLASVKSDDQENALDYESTELAEDDDSAIEPSSLDENVSTNKAEDNPSAVANIDNLTKVYDDSENISRDTSDDDAATFANTTDIPDEHLDSTSRKMEISNDEHSTLPITDDLPVPDSDSENILQETSNDELPTSIKSDHSPAEHTDLENIKLKVPDDEPFELVDIDDVLETHPDPENISRNISTDEFLAPTESDESSVEDTEPQTMQTDILDNTSTTSTNVVDLPKDESPSEDSDVNDTLSVATNIDHPPKSPPNLDNILTNIPDDALPTTANITDSSDVHSGSKNILLNIPDDELPVFTDVDVPSYVEPNSANILMNIPDDELPTIEDAVERPVIHPSPANIQTKEAQSDSENILINIPDDALPSIEDIPTPSVVNPSAENILMSIPDNELPTLANMNQSSIVDSTSKTAQTKPTDEKLTNVNEQSLSHSAPENLPINQSNNNEVSTSKNKITTPPNEFEDSFEELKTTYVPVHRAPEKPANETTHLATLRNFLSELNDDDNDDDDLAKPISFKQDNRILEKSITTAAESLTTPNNRQKTLSLSSASSTDDTTDDIFNDRPAPSNTLSDEPSIDGISELMSTVSIDTKSIEKKRSSIVNSHSIPPGTKIQHINCSSTYIYFCTTDRKIFYAKLNLTTLEDSFEWQQHIDLADQLVVSASNRTVWRLHNKTLYAGIDPIKHPPIGSCWNKIQLGNSQALLSTSINDHCGWFIKVDGTLWLLRTDDRTYESINIACPFNLDQVFCFGEKVGVSTSDGEILIRAGCTHDVPEGGGWIFIEHSFGPIDDFILLTNNDVLAIVDKKHHLWLHQWSTERGFYEILCDDNFYTSNQPSLVSVNSELLCFTDCEKQIHTFSDCLTGVKWTVVEENTRLQRLIGAFSDEDYVWALTTDRRVSSSKSKAFPKPRQAQYLTHATFVPQNSSQNTVLWSLDESCGIYVRPNLEDSTEWEQANQIQFDWSRRLVNIVCSNTGVWAVDDQGYVYFRHGHISASQNVGTYGTTFLPPAWISVPGEAKRHRFFVQIFCGPMDWMIYATDNKQNVYTRVGINKENRVGTSWKAIEDCSALELAISEHTLWLLTSCGEIQCRENISLSTPIGTRSTTLSGFFLSLTVSMDDSQVWALDSKRNLMKLDRLTVLFEK